MPLDSVELEDSNVAAAPDGQVVALDPGQHVTILSADQEHVQSAVVVTAASIDPETDQQQQSIPVGTGSNSPRKRTCFSIVKDWIWELLACLLAVFMVVVEIVLLLCFDHLDSAIRGFSWKPNSIFAFLTTILEAAIAFAIASCMGQLRWLCFQKGAQELRWQDGYGQGKKQPYLSMISAIDVLFLQPSSVNATDTIVKYFSSNTGSCTFGNYSYLGVCSQCADVSNSIVNPCNSSDCPDYTLDYLRNGSLYLQPAYGWVNITSDTDYPDDSILPDIGPLVTRY